MSVLICPVCRQALFRQGNSLKCINNHSFDFSKDGYVNLLLTSKSGDKTGDSKESARARHTFLKKGYYGCLKKAISEKMCGTVLDICCGDGYYDDSSSSLYGFDISKEMVRLAARNNKNGNYFVANLASIPVMSESVDTAIHLFAPFNEKEFSRVLKKEGRLYSVTPGKNHLFEMKSIVYDKPYKNDEKTPDVTLLEVVSKQRITEKVEIGTEDLKTLFSMTPYFYRTSPENKARLNNVDFIKLTVDFIITEYRKKIV